MNHLFAWFVSDKYGFNPALCFLFFFHFFIAARKPKFCFWYSIFFILVDIIWYYWYFLSPYIACCQHEALRFLLREMSCLTLFEAISISAESDFNMQRNLMPDNFHVYPFFFISYLDSSCLCLMHSDFVVFFICHDS